MPLHPGAQAEAAGAPHPGVQAEAVVPPHPGAQAEAVVPLHPGVQVEAAERSQSVPADVMGGEEAEIATADVVMGGEEPAGEEVAEAEMGLMTDGEIFHHEAARQILGGGC